MAKRKTTPKHVLPRTDADVRARVDEIEAVAGDGNASRCDDEQAHLLEDALYEQVLRVIAEGQMDDWEMRDLAREALKSKDIEFSRWSS